MTYIMKKFIYPLLLTIITVLLTAGISRAQFEGRILYDSYEIDASGARQKGDQFTMHITPERILLQGENRYSFVGSIQTEGVLVRLDYEDFIFLTGSAEVLKISKADIVAMMNMFGGGNGEDIEPDVNYRHTGENKTIKGYRCEKFVFTDKENPAYTSEIWMTKGVNINWGMLAEPWGDKTEKMLGEDIPFKLIFEEGYLPLVVESYDNGNLTSIMEATEISETSIAKALVQIPSGVKMLSFQDYLFRKMSQN